MASISKLFEFILPKKKAKTDGNAYTNTYRPGNATTLTAPDYREHLEDLYDTRINSDSNELLQDLFRQDPDCSAAVNAYLTSSNTPMVYYAINADGEIDQDGTKTLEYLIDKITSRTDYTLNYQMKSSLSSIREELKYMLLLRGAAGAELVFDKTLQPKEIRNVDMHYVQWMESKNGEFKPVQKTQESGEEVSLDIPTFFTTFFRRDPTSVYTYSYFVSAINVIAARQQVINDLYRIMNVTGFPRIDITVLEEVIKKNTPAEIQASPDKYREYVASTVQAIANRFNAVKPQQPLSHTDSVEVKMINDKNPGGSLQIAEVIETLNGQNQAAMKVVGSVLGRGSSGVNTASVEAMVFAKNASELNKPIDYLLSEIFTLALRMTGFDGKAVMYSRDVELRTSTELENQLTMRQARLLEQLSLGIIDDVQYYLEMWGKVPSNPSNLSGTNFQSIKINTSDTTSNTDPLGRSLTPDGGDMAKSNANKTTKDQQKGKDLN
ncbi:MAG: hypothetical protein J6Z11_04110 [Candidatus Riflebacteria bacterium]|nr:hypothetical protein [Candidatus Riflebacteria bacterium]